MDHFCYNFVSIPPIHESGSKWKPMIEATSTSAATIHVSIDSNGCNWIYSSWLEPYNTFLAFDVKGENIFHWKVMPTLIKVWSLMNDQNSTLRMKKEWWWFDTMPSVSPSKWRALNTHSSHSLSSRNLISKFNQKLKFSALEIKLQKNFVGSRIWVQKCSDLILF